MVNSLVPFRIDELICYGLGHEKQGIWRSRKEQGGAGSKRRGVEKSMEERGETG